MDAGKEILFLERREVRSKDIPIIFTNADLVKTGFLVLAKDTEIDEDGLFELKDIRYFCQITADKQNDSCTCLSMYHGNSEKWLADHGYSFNCKHLIRGRELRYG